MTNSMAKWPARKGNYRKAKGSATVEMAVIMPLGLLVFFLIVTATFYFHDKCVLYATAYETAVVAAQKERRGDLGYAADLTAHFEKRVREKLIFFSSSSVDVKEKGEYVQVEIKAAKGTWKIYGRQRAMLMKTEKMIYGVGEMAGRP